MSDRFPTRQAVVVIHGIGEQRPMQTLRGFVDAIVSDKNRNASGQRYWNKPDRMSESFELRRFTAPGDGKNWPRTDYFEYYWAANMRDSTWPQVIAWLSRLLVTPPGRIPPRVRWLWWTTWVLAAVVLVLLVTLWPRYSESVSTFLKSSVVFGLVITGFTAAINRVFLTYIADAARYLSPHPDNIAQRQAIRRDGIALIRRLHECGKYGRIIVVGHSLGSVIAYDVLRFVWDELRNDEPTPDTDAKRACIRAMKEMIRSGIPEESDDPEAHKKRREWLDAFQKLQEQLWRAERSAGSKWLVTNLVTCGSPLAHASILLACSEDELEQRKRERELPTCPPTTQAEEDAFTYKRRVRDSIGRSIGEAEVLHTSALFACVKWTNLYFEADFIGGPLAGVFGQAIRDIRVDAEPAKAGHRAKRRRWAFLKGHTPLSHGMYWARKPSKDPLLQWWRSVSRLRGAMDVNRMDLVTFPDPLPTRPSIEESYGPSA